MLSEAQSYSEKSEVDRSSDLDSETMSKPDNASHSNHNTRAPVATQSHRNADASPETDLVSSTNKEDEEFSSQPSQSQSSVELKQSDPSSDDKSESAVYEDSEVSYSENVDNKSESTFTSLEPSENTTEENKRSHDDDDLDDSDDVRERRNRRLCAEREVPNQYEDNNKPKNFPQNFQRNRHTRPQMPRQNPFGVPGTPDFNPLFMPQFRGARRPMQSLMQPEFMRSHTISMMRGPPNHMQRMPPSIPPHPSRMQGGPPHLGPPHQRLQRPPFQSPAMFSNNPGIPLQGNHLKFI